MKLAHLVLGRPTGLLPIALATKTCLGSNYYNCSLLHVWTAAEMGFGNDSIANMLVLQQRFIFFLL